MAALADSTYKQYNSELKKWVLFCSKNNIKIENFEVKDVIRFLTEEFKKGTKYGSLNSMRATISKIGNTDLSNNRDINTFFKGLYRLRPSLSKYSFTWDVELVLSELESWFPLESLDLTKLTQKLVMLLALGTGFRVQNLAFLKLDDIISTQAGVQLKVTDLIKTSKAGKTCPHAYLPFFTSRPKICIAKTIIYYINRTENIRENAKNLILTIRSPHGPASKETISRWIKDVLKICKIDEQFKSHSTRHASTSKAYRAGLDINIIKQAATWSENSAIFSKFYHRQLIDTRQNFAKSVFNENSSYNK